MKKMKPTTVFIISNGEKQGIVSLLSEKEARKFCKGKDWKWLDERGNVFRLDYERKKKKRAA